MSFKRVTFPPPLQEARGSGGGSLLYSLWEPGQAPGGKLTKAWGPPPPHDGVSLEFLTLRLIHTGASSNSSVTVQVFLPRNWLPRRFVLVGFCSGKLWFSVFTRLSSNLGGSGLPCDLTSLTDLRRVADFSVCAVFCLLGWSGNSQAPYLLDWNRKSCPSVVLGSLSAFMWIWKFVGIWWSIVGGLFPHYPCWLCLVL